MTRRNVLVTVACYAALVALVFGVAVLRVKTQHRFAAQTAPDELPEYETYRTPVPEDAKPFFSLVTNRTYGTSDRTRIWVNYRGVDSLDFRVYRVKDPVQFFRQLDNPHQVGEDEEAKVGEQVKRQPTFLEKLRAFKVSWYGSFKSYVRAQLQRNSRKSFNQRFRQSDEDDTSNRTPLNVADFARVPLLNEDQMVSSWREKLPPLEDLYDRRMISLGKREAGVYLIEAVHGELRAFGVAVVTDLALVQKATRSGDVLVYAVDRKSGAPREGVRVEVVEGERRSLTAGTTDRQGIMRFKIEKPKPAEDGGAAGEEGEEAAEDEGADAAEGDAAAEESAEEETTPTRLIMATAGEQFAVSDLDSVYFGEYAEEGGGGEEILSYVYTDRPVYRPEHKVYFRGILRERREGGYRLPSGPVTVTVDDPNGARLYEQQLTLSTRGTFSGELDLPEEAPLGSYNITAHVGETQAAGGYFEVNEYKKPEFKATVTAQQQFVTSGDTAKFNVTARYFFGAPVARAEVKYYVYRSRYYGWWRNYDGDGSDQIEDEFGEDPTAEGPGSGGGYYGDEVAHEGEGRLDAQGRLEVGFKIPDASPKDNWDYTYRLEAQVTDPSRRTMSGSGSLVGVRGRTVASARPDRYVYYQGDTAKVAVRARDYDGRPVRTRVKVSFVERRWKKVTKRTEEGYEYPDYEQQERELSSAAVETNDRGEAGLDYVVQAPGSIHIKTTVEENGRQITSEGGSFWAADRENRWTDVSYQEEETIKLVPDKKAYRPGETAHVLALLPTEGAHLLVTTELMSVMTVSEARSTGRSVILHIPVEPRYAPNVFLNVTYVKNGEMYTQELMLIVPARDKLLNVEIVPDKREFRPRETASYTVVARNADGSPAAGAEVSLGVVDESVYQITPESVEDIRRAFYGRRYNEVSTSFSVNFHFTGYAGTKPVRLARERRPTTFADVKNDDMVNPRVRKIFKDTAFWQPAIVTGADGRATVKVELPDNLTTWRATARAVTADTRVGLAVAKVVARKDVILRVAMPRFLTQGDTATLSAVVHNYLKSEKTTQISLEVAGGRLLDPPAQTVTIPSQGEHRVNWRVAVADTGELRLLGKALTDTESDAVEVGLPIVARGLKETRGETAALPEEDVEKRFVYTLPANADRNARTLRVEFAPTIAGTLFGALDYLSTFPYGCTEQTMSSFLPNVIVAQTLQNVESATVKDKDKLDKRVRRGLRRLYAYQHSDGGWGWWKDDESDHFMTAYVVDGLTQAKRAGYEVDDARIDRARERLRSMLDETRGSDKPGSQEARAYMTYALNESGEADARYADELFNARSTLQPYGRALLALTLLERGDKRRAQIVAAEIERSASGDDLGAHWPSRNYSHGVSLYSNDVEATALSVKALALLSPQSPLLPRAARWLVMSRKHGYYWLSTRDTAFAIFGLTDYLKASRELEADYTLEVYLNDEQVLARQVTAADASAAQTFTIQKRGAELGGSNELRVVKRGRGVAYVSSTVTYHTNDEQVAAQSTPQLSLTREYLRLRLVPGENNVMKWQTEPLSGELRSGDIIVSRLRVEGQPGSYLLVEDPIPAGCEQAGEVGGLVLSHREKDWSSWYSAREFRDQRTAFFLSHFSGRAVYQYAMRVQVPGAFRVAPARVEQMYQPSVRANSASAALTILDK